MKAALSTLLVVLLLAAGTSLALASKGGSPSNSHAGYGQYHHKPGCGPDKTDGVAGGSGRHDGQPPKDDNRGDCPKPPGQQKP